MIEIKINNKRKDLADLAAKYINSHKSLKDMSAIDIYNQFVHDNNLMITDDLVSDWLLNFIYDIKKIDVNFLKESLTI